MLRNPNDTIAAISTPPGEGGIGIVRLSGREAVAIAGRIFRAKNGRDITTARRRVWYGQAFDEHGGVIDEVLLHVMRAPNSYTREDVVEFNAHGGAGPLGALLEQTLVYGARLAEPGEFTQRAFLNGRIDLVQAEAVIDRIQARTRASLRAAASAASGTLSNAINTLKATLTDALARIEAAVDFPDEDLPDLVNEALRQDLIAARATMVELLATAETGRLYREGASIAIAGRPNVGKSSLFNALLRDARAIVSPQPGTTRDRIEEMITLSGVPVRLMDTAGLREAGDEVERIGVAIARRAFAEAELLLFIVDNSEPLTDEDQRLADELASLERPVWLVLNKTDLPAVAAAPETWFTWLKGVSPVSAATNEGLPDLEQQLGALLLGGSAISPDQGLITRAHQRDSLRRASAALERLLSDFDASPELLSVDLRDALGALGEITGETTPEDVLDRIFSAFCVGK